MFNELKNLSGTNEATIDQLFSKANNVCNDAVSKAVQ